MSVINTARRALRCYPIQFSFKENDCLIQRDCDALDFHRTLSTRRVTRIRILAALKNRSISVKIDFPLFLSSFLPSSPPSFFTEKTERKGKRLGLPPRFSTRSGTTYYSLWGNRTEAEPFLLKTYLKLNRCPPRSKFQYEFFEISNEGRRLFKNLPVP